MAHIGRTVHGHDVLARQDVVEDREHRLLHLAGVGGAADQNDAAGEVEGDHGLAAGAVTGRIGLEVRGMQDGELRHEILQVSGQGLDQQMAQEQVVPGMLVHHAHVQPVLGIGARIQVSHEQFLAAQIFGDFFLEPGESVLRHLGVVGPPDIGFRTGLADDVLVLGGTAGVLPGLDDERAADGHHAFAAAHRFLEQDGGVQVPVHRALRPDAVLIQTEIADTRVRGSHGPISQICHDEW